MMCKLQNNLQTILSMSKIFILLLICFVSTNLLSKENNDYFKKGKDNYNKKKY